MEPDSYLYHGSPNLLDGGSLKPSGEFLPPAIAAITELKTFATTDPRIALAFGCKQPETHSIVDPDFLKRLTDGNVSAESLTETPTIKTTMLKGTFKLFGYFKGIPAAIANDFPAPKQPIYVHKVSVKDFSHVDQALNLVPIFETEKIVPVIETTTNTLADAIRQGLKVFYFNPEAELETYSNGEMHTKRLKDMSNEERAFATQLAWSNAYDANKQTSQESFEAAITTLLEKGLLLDLSPKKAAEPAPKIETTPVRLPMQQPPLTGLDL